MSLVVRVAVVAALLTCSACWPGGLLSDGNDGEDTTSDPNAPQPLGLAWGAALPLLPEDKPRSIRYRQATLLWRTATVAFARGQFGAAAHNFFDVAKALQAERPHPHASTFAVARCLAYENASRALAYSPDRNAARQTWSEAVAEEAACPAAIRRGARSLEVERPSP